MRENNVHQQKKLHITPTPSESCGFDYSSILVAIFELMLIEGIRAGDLLSVCARALKRASDRIRTDRQNECGELETAALVLDAWHRDRRYLSEKGTPKGVRLRGPTPSVTALIRAQKGRHDPLIIVRRLRALRLIVRSGSGTYKPTSDAVVVSVKSPLILQHAARSLSTLLETVIQNVSGTRNPAPLIERVAEVPDLPLKDITAFRIFTHVQGRAFLRTVNDWLEARRARRSRRKGANGTVRAGIHTYAYVASKHRRGFPMKTL